MLRTTVKLLVRPVLVTATILALVATGQAGLSGRRPVGPPGASYELQWGDTLSSVAAKYGISVNKLAAANGISNIHKVQAGMKLTIPSPTAAAPGAAAPAPNSKLPVGLLARPERLSLAPAFDTWAKAYNVPSDLLKALAWMESGWQNSVVSPVAALGIGQLTPDTVKFVSGDLLKTKLDPKIPEHNIRMSSRFLRYLLDQTGNDPKMALAAYYQGLGSLRRQGPLLVSVAYVNAILALRPQFA